jgi:hypothetical protein
MQVERILFTSPAVSFLHGLTEENAMIRRLSMFLATVFLVAAPSPASAQQDLPLTDIPEVPADGATSGNEGCIAGDPESSRSPLNAPADIPDILSGQLQDCGGVLAPPDVGDGDIEESAPDPDPNTTPVIPPEVLPQEQPPRGR